MSGETAGVRPGVALALATVAFVTLVIGGFGMLSLALDVDAIPVQGLGQMPGVIATVLATAAFAASLWIAIRRRPWFAAALGCVAAPFLAYLVGIWLGGALTGADLAVAAAAVGAVATSWFGLLIAVAGLAAGWGGVALVRTRADRPRWPWEDPFDE